VFEILSDEDLTEAITPTFVIHEYLKNEKVAPFAQRFRAALKADYPWRSWALEKMLGRSLDKLGRKIGTRGKLRAGARVSADRPEEGLRARPIRRNAFGVRLLPR
jgi:hypothetical protein